MDIEERVVREKEEGKEVGEGESVGQEKERDWKVIGGDKEREKGI